MFLVICTQDNGDIDTIDKFQYEEDALNEIQNFVESWVDGDAEILKVMETFKSEFGDKKAQFQPKDCEYIIHLRKI